MKSLRDRISVPKHYALGPLLFGEFNGDGRDDIANFHDANGTGWAQLSIVG